MSFTRTFSSSIQDRDEGFQNGYRRAVNDLLAEFPLISQEFLRRRPAASGELQAALRAFREHLERSASVSISDHLVKDGLGI